MIIAARPLVGPPGLHDPPHGLRNTARVVGERLAVPLTPTRRLLAALPPPPPFRLVALYRARNAARTSALVRSANAGAALWALDQAHPDLADHTVGFGPGSRFVNINRITPVQDGRTWLVVADDAVELPHASLADAVALAARAGLDISMPSHGPGSFVSWESTRCRPQSVVRLTRFVDQAPLLLLSPAAQAAILPFDETMGTGWGAALRWAVLDNLRIGVLDAVRMRYLNPVSPARCDDAERTRAEDLLAGSPWSTWRDAQAELDRWPRGSSAPSWMAGF